MKSSGVRSIARNTALLFLAQGVGIAARMVYVIIVARVLGPELYALLAYGFSWTLVFLSLAIFGLGVVMTHAISTDHAHTGEIASATLGIRITTALGAAVLSTVGAQLIAPDPRVPALIGLLAVGLVGRGLAMWAQHLFVALEANQYTLRQETVFRLAELFGAGITLALGGGLLMLAALQAVVWWLQAVLALRTVDRHFVRVRPTLAAARVKPLLAHALPLFMIAATVDWRVFGPVVMFGNLHADAAVTGHLALALQPLLIAIAVPQALVTAAQPVLTRSAARGDGKDLLFGQAIHRAAFVIGTGIALVGFGLAPFVVPLLFGAEFRPAGDLVGWSLACLIPIFAGNAFGSVLVARGQLRWPWAVSLAGAGAMTLSLPPLVAYLGPLGAIGAFALGFAIPAAFTLAVAVSRGWAALETVLMRPAAASLLSLLTFAALNGPLTAPVAMLAGFVVLGLATAGLRVVTATELTAVRNLAR